MTARAAGLLVLFLLTGACGGEQPEAGPLPEGAVQVSRPGVSLVAPAGWEVREHGEPLHPASVVDLQPVGADSVTPAVLVVTETGNVAAALDIQAFTAAFTGQQRLTIPEYELLDSEPVDVPGAREAMRLVIDYDDDGVAHRELTLIALVGEVDQVVVRAVAPIAELADVEGDLQAILASVRVDADGLHGGDA